MTKVERSAAKGHKGPELHPFKNHLPISLPYPCITYSIFIFKQFPFFSLNIFIQEENSILYFHFFS